jgi:exonuclease-1
MVQALKAAAVEFIVAPYEADAQMAYLALNGMVHAVSNHLPNSSA